MNSQEIGFTWIDGVLVRAMERGEWLLLENVTSLKSEIETFIKYFTKYLLFLPSIIFLFFITFL